MAPTLPSLVPPAPLLQPSKRGDRSSDVLRSSASRSSIASTRAPSEVSVTLRPSSRCSSRSTRVPSRASRRPPSKSSASSAIAQAEASSIDGNAVATVAASTVKKVLTDISVQRLKEVMNDSSSVVSKHADLQSKVDTLAKLESKKLLPGEMFMRIKPLTLAGLIQENEVAESVFGLCDDDQNSDARSCAPSAVPTVAGSFVSVVAADADTAENCKGYVVYDLREADEYASQHIISALSYPARLLNYDKISRELHKLKSSQTKLIVYHANEALGAAVAAQLVHKGWENTCLLSGGFKEFAERFPELVEDGEIQHRFKSDAPATTAKSRRPPRVPSRRAPRRVSSLQRLPPSP
eukprot:gnl/MRDRNA2_/MRDRNA2_105846_c0_seq1.p1 gnl/MRDRNA2_/MRDRNA2_105846_c0~~gnl/MRDRNA2_/MRDRNA2_105846_c0_seq1.p1  ORF type:complete len:352 (-),score=51.35 gnl/MRDRNA2_/MRDRNA2_105846_c0_seq1:294-1349(-)